MLNAAPVYRSSAVTRPDGAVIAYYMREASDPTLKIEGS